MAFLFILLIICMSFTGMAHRIKITKAYNEQLNSYAMEKKAAADKCELLLNNYIHTSTTIPSAFILHSKHIYVSVGRRDLYGCFVFLTSDGVSFCTESDPENTFTISYGQITRITFDNNASCSPMADPLTFMSKLRYLKFELVNSENRDIVVYFHFSDNESDPEFIFNQQSLQKDNFFAELEKHTNKLYNDTTGIAKILE